jgi:hypothetical protein
MLTGWRQILVEIESVVSLVSAYAGGFLPPLLLAVGALVAGTGRAQLPFCIILASCAAVTAVSAVWVARMAQAALAESCPRLARLLGGAHLAVWRPDSPLAPGTPLAVVMAYRLPRIHWLLRPVVGLWWGAHFAGVAALGIMVKDVLNEVLRHAPLFERVALPLSMHLILLFAANLYLLLAVAVFFRNPTVHGRVWSWRFMIDLAMSLLALGLATQR